MIDYIRPLLAGQYGAALQMLTDCVATCPADQWAAVMAKRSFRSVAYHTMFITEEYLAPVGFPFAPRDLHDRADGQRSSWSERLSQAETLAYAADVRRRVAAALAAETDASIQGASGCSWHERLTRGEMHVYNIRHVQHHAGQLAAHLRRVTPIGDDPDALAWVDRA